MTGDLTFFKTNAVNYYGVFCEDYDTVNPYADMLSNVRRKYFETHSRQKDKLIKNLNGTQYRYQYTLDEDRPLKWKVYTDTQVLEKVTVGADEKYFVEVCDTHGTLKKRIYFGCYHNWEKTQFFKDGEREPSVELAAWDFNNVSVILRYRRNVQKPEVLYPCAATEDEDMLCKITEKVGTPDVASMCSMGYVYFAPKEMSREWNALCEQYRRDPTLYRIPQSAGVRVRKEEAPVKKPVTVTPVKAAVSKSTDTIIPKRKRVDLRNTAEIVVPEKRKPETVIISSGHTPAERGVKPDDGSSSAANTLYVKPRPMAQSGSGGSKQSENEFPKSNKNDGYNDSGKEESSTLHAPHSTGARPLPKLHSDALAAYSSEEHNASISSLDSLSDSTFNSIIDTDEPEEYIIKAADVKREVKSDSSSSTPADSSHVNVTSEQTPAAVNNSSSSKQFTDELSESNNSGTAPHSQKAFSVKKVQATSEPAHRTIPVDKVIRVSDSERYLYFGELKSGRRCGRGRTMMENGSTAYEGGYLDDKRDGFGVYYYKTGRICYVGDWKANRRNGVGVAFQPSDRSMYVGGWDNDCPIGMGAKFDKNGNLSFAGRWEDGEREGAGMMYNPEDGSIFVSRWENDTLSDKGTKFDAQGNLIYSGSWNKGKREGKGTAYDKRGLVLYTGSWRDDKYDGKGTLYLSGGYRIEGDFKQGKVNGYAVAVNKQGGSLYEGQWQDNRYHGEGRLYMADGSYCQGSFEQGEPVGILSGYSGDGTLLYTGEWRGGRFHGKGICYSDGEKVYEGDLRGGRRQGKGHEYADGRCVYIGSFEDNIRNGFGTSYDENGNVIYCGQWRGGVYDGCGLLYEHGVPKYAGQLSSGELHGRVNEILDGRVVRECMYSEGKLVYMREYTDDSLTLKYDGNIKNGLYEGMGCSFSPYGEKYFEGIFRRGEPFKNMKVRLRELEPLPYCDDMTGSEYNKYIKGPSYVVEQEYRTEGDAVSGVYSGLLADGKPEGNGTMLYADHGYTGAFSGGVACGLGVIYEWDGSEITGTFVKEAGSNTTEITLEGGVTYHLLNE